jgi:hypothetical protein
MKPELLLTVAMSDPPEPTNPAAGENQPGVGSRLTVVVIGLICAGMGLFGFLDPSEQCWWLCKVGGAFFTALGGMLAILSLIGDKSDFASVSPGQSASDAGGGFVTELIGSIISRLF